MDTICPKQLEKFIYHSDKWSARNCPIFALLAMTWDWHSQYLRKQLGVLGYNIVDCNNMIVIAFILAVYKYYYEA